VQQFRDLCAIVLLASGALDAQLCSTRGVYCTCQALSGAAALIFFKRSGDKLMLTTSE
jgi:hypothetical protein